MARVGATTALNIVMDTDIEYHSKVNHCSFGSKFSTHNKKEHRLL